jgi:hypothetical protein
MGIDTNNFYSQACTQKLSEKIILILELSLRNIFDKESRC